MVCIDFTVREDDGAAWYESGKIVINLRWLNFDWEVESYILECIIHEYIEHVVGLGHRAALYAEKIVRGLLLEMGKTVGVEAKRCQGVRLWGADQGRACQALDELVSL